MEKLVRKIAWYFFLFILVCKNTLLAQHTGAQLLWEKLLSEDSATVVTIAIYPSATRNNMLELCKSPNVLVQLETVQKKSKNDFRLVMNNFSREEQEKTWELVRYPGLVSQMVQAKDKPYAEIENLAKTYPAEIQPVIIDYCQHKQELLKSVDLLNSRNQYAYESFTSPLAASQKTALNELIKQPDAITLLCGNMRTTALLGEISKTDHAFISHKLDSISLAYAGQMTKELDDWKNGLEQNPEAKKEMETAGKEFANEQGYTPEQVNNTVVVVNYVYQPYPYWYGYPWWYEYPYWYPYPWWHHCGYYWGPHGIVYMGMPSPYFTWWYFHHHHHHSSYSHFSDYYLHHHHGHRESFSASHREVRQWVRENEKKVPPGYFADDSRRPERLKELGRFETEFSESAKRNPGLSREEFLQANTSRFPNIRPLQNTNKPNEIKPGQNTKPVQKPVEKNPPVKPSNPGGNKPIPKQPKPGQPGQPKQPSKIPPTQKVPVQPKTPKPNQPKQPVRNLPKSKTK